MGENQRKAPQALGERANSMLRVSWLGCKPRTTVLQGRSANHGAIVFVALLLQYKCSKSPVSPMTHLKGFSGSRYIYIEQYSVQNSAKHLSIFPRLYKRCQDILRLSGVLAGCGQENVPLLSLSLSLSRWMGCLSNCHTS